MTKSSKNKPSDKTSVLGAIECEFNILNEGLKHTGHHRKYLLENARKVCYDPATREGIRLKEKLGYFGHGRRVLSDKLMPEETEVAHLKDGGKVVIQNVPSNVTTSFEIDNDGTVRHTQEILDTEPGRIVKALNDSQVGGFSWAMGGNDVGSVGTTRVTSFAGFDYVLNPGFARNRGYVLESAGSGRSLVLESLSQVGIDEHTAEAYLNNWSASANLRVMELENCLARQSAELSQMHEKLRDANQKLRGHVEPATALVSPAEASHEQARALLESLSLRSTIFLPPYVKEALLSPPDEDNIQTILDFMQRCTQINLGRLPLNVPGFMDDQADDQKNRIQPPDIEYGTADAGLALADIENGRFFR